MWLLAWEDIPADVSSRFTVWNLPVRQPLPFMPSLKRKRQEALPHSLMQNMLSTASAQQNWVDVDNLLISQPDNGEQALEIAEQLIRSSAIDIIVVDSVGCIDPESRN